MRGRWNPCWFKAMELNFQVRSTTLLSGYCVKAEQKTEVVFYDDDSCNGQEVFRTRNGGCVDIVGFGVKSFALRDRD